jgi:MFS family permease
MPRPQSARLFYGYVVVAACFVVLFLVWGMVLNTFPIFLKPIAESMNWGRGQVALALLTGSIGTAVAAPIAGAIVDRTGARPVMVAGALIIGLGLLAGSRITHLWQLYVVFVAVGCGLMCASIIPCSLIISNWFVSRRGAAMSGAFVGTSAGGMVMSPVANWIILDYGWRTAFALSGTTILVVVIPVVLLAIRTHPSEVGLEPYRIADGDNSHADENWGFAVKDALSLRSFWQIAAVMLILGLVPGGLGNHCVAYLTDLEHSPDRAAFAWSLVMGVMILGKLSIGPLADRWGSRNAMAAACVLFAVSIAILTFARPYSVVLVFAALYGFACGAPLVLNPLLTSEYLGMKHFGALYGLLNIMGTVGGAVGAVGAGIYFDRAGSYLPVFYLFVIMMLVAMVVAISMHPRGPRPGAADASPLPEAVV